jgi:hypothetical protein
MGIALAKHRDDLLISGMMDASPNSYNYGTAHAIGDYLSDAFFAMPSLYCRL